MIITKYICRQPSIAEFVSKYIKEGDKRVR